MNSGATPQAPPRKLSDGDIDAVEAMYPVFSYSLYTAPGSTTPDTLARQNGLALVGVTQSITSMNYNGDGIDELVTYNGTSLLIWNAEATQLLAHNFLNFGGSISIAGGDFDGDGDDEIMIVSQMGIGVVGELQSTNAAPITWVASDHWMIPATQNFVRITGLDYDGDGQDEVATFKF